MNEGGFYDPWGYKFSTKDKDENGNEIWKDDYGGYFDENGQYIPGKEYEQQYYEQFEEQELDYGDEEEEEDEEDLEY